MEYFSKFHAFFKRQLEEPPRNDIYEGSELSNDKSDQKIYPEIGHVGASEQYHYLTRLPEFINHNQKNTTSNIIHMENKEHSDDKYRCTRKISMWGVNSVPPQGINMVGKYCQKINRQKIRPGRNTIAGKSGQNNLSLPEVRALAFHSEQEEKQF